MNMPSDFVMNNYIPVPESGCWLWLGNWNPWGYGAVKRRGVWLSGAHQLFYREHVGPIPSGMRVCHKCDVPACCNPAHLFLGTDSDNQRDRLMKGRTRVPTNPRRVRNVERTCLHCGHAFKAPAAEVNRGRAKFCCFLCARRGAKELAALIGEKA